MGLLESIAKEQGIRMMDYKEGEKTLDLLREKFEISETCKGFAVAPNRKIEGLSPLVMYNEELTGTGRVQRKNSEKSGTKTVDKC